MIESDLVKIRTALEEPSLVESIESMEKVLEELGYRKPLDRTELREIKEKLNKIGEHASEIRGDWTDPRYDCKQIGQLVDQIRELLALIVPKDKQHEQKGARAFLGLPIEERRKILAIQAQNLADNIADSRAKEDSKMMD